MKCISIFVPGNIQPYQRGVFIDPLDEILQKEDVGEVVEEGTRLAHINGQQVIEGCEIHLEVSNIKRALELISEVFGTHSLPSDTSISFTENGSERNLRLDQLK
jgi:hypothetical protein